MKTRTKFLGWSALFVLVAVLFVPSIIAFKAEAAPMATYVCPLEPKT